MRPPCFSTILLVMASPSPVPPGRVVKNGLIGGALGAGAARHGLEVLLLTYVGHEGHHLVATSSGACAPFHVIPVDEEVRIEATDLVHDAAAGQQ